MDNSDIVLEVCKFLPICDIVNVLSTCNRIRSINISKGHYYSYIRSLSNKCTNYYLEDDRIIYYPGTDEPFFDCDYLNEKPEIIEIALDTLKSYFPDVKRGDVIWDNSIPSVIYDGDKFELFTYDNNYQIRFPSRYNVPTEFPLTYWSRIEVAPFDYRPHLSELIANFHYTNDTEYANTYFVYNYVRYNILVRLDLLDVELPLLFANSRYLLADARSNGLSTSLVLEPNFA